MIELTDEQKAVMAELKELALQYPVGNQGNLASSVGFATAAMVALQPLTRGPEPIYYYKARRAVDLNQISIDYGFRIKEIEDEVPPKNDLD